ncbi:MAG: transketolase [Firmicutes bacterium]|nr:transketolase [Bacillota bacterium]
MENVQLNVNALRFLGLDQIEKAKSGHPGIVLGAAPMLYTLYTRHMRHNPKNPHYAGRDRFVLSAGHGSALLYAMLHLCGYNITKEDLKQFRSLASKTEGHPKLNVGLGIEASTGALGQGFANAVGMALASKHFATNFNTAEATLIDNYTYCLVGDGCLMEGIAYEAASLAGSLGLCKLIVLYDSNDMTIEGRTEITYKEDVAATYRGMHWNVLEVADGRCVESIDAAITLAKSGDTKPTLIIVKTKLGYGSPASDTPGAHGSPLGADGITDTRKYFKYSHPPFETPPQTATFFKQKMGEWAKWEEEHKRQVREYKRKQPELYDKYLAFFDSKKAVQKVMAESDFWADDGKPKASREYSGLVLNKLNKLLPNLIGGSADLGPSCKSYLSGAGDYHVNPVGKGKNIAFGIREHAKAAILNGLALYGGLNVFGSTFFVFSDYMKYAMRMSALMELPVMYVLTHDSIGVGEDGATHQPVEQLIGLRAIPNMHVWRPFSYKETAAAYISTIASKSPSSIVLSRQTIDNSEIGNSEFKVSNSEFRIQNSELLQENILKGGYVLYESEGFLQAQQPDNTTSNANNLSLTADRSSLIIIATGSEIPLAYEVAKKFEAQNAKVRLVSMPCVEVFEAQSAKYKESILPAGVRARVAVEAASSYSWHKYVGLDGLVIGIDSFGLSAPADKLFKVFGFSADSIFEKALKMYKAIIKQSK